MRRLRSASPITMLVTTALIAMLLVGMASASSSAPLRGRMVPTSAAHPRGRLGTIWSVPFRRAVWRLRSIRVRVTVPTRAPSSPSTTSPPAPSTTSTSTTTPSPATSAPVPSIQPEVGVALTREQVLELASGWSDWNAEVMTNLAWCESRGEWWVSNPTPVYYGGFAHYAVGLEGNTDGSIAPPAVEMAQAHAKWAAQGYAAWAGDFSDGCAYDAPSSW